MQRPHLKCEICRPATGIAGSHSAEGRVKCRFHRHSTAVPLDGVQNAIRSPLPGYSFPCSTHQSRSDHMRSRDPVRSLPGTATHGAEAILASPVLTDLRVPVLRGTCHRHLASSRQCEADRGHKSLEQRKNEAIQSSNDGWMYGAHGRNTRTNCKGGRSEQENRGHV